MADLTGTWYDDPIARDYTDNPTAFTDRQAGVIYVTYQALAEPAGNRFPGVLLGFTPGLPDRILPHGMARKLRIQYSMERETQ